MLTPLPDDAVDELVAVPPVDDGVGCDVTNVDAVLAAWERARTPLGPRHRLVVHRLGTYRSPPAEGRSRIAEQADGPLLDRWYDALMAANPDDASDRAYVVADPLADGRIVLREIDGGRSTASRWRWRAGPV